jgi:hypothetical protein
MTYTNETGGILKEEAKKWRGASKAMNIGATEPQPSPTTWSEPGTSWIKWVTLLQTRLADCPTDTLTRCALASLRSSFANLAHVRAPDCPSGSRPHLVSARTAEATRLQRASICK